jgi:hypothetical protein
MPRQSPDTVAVLGIDIGKNTFHLVGLNKRGAIVLRPKLSRRQLEARLANLPPLPDRHGSLRRRRSPQPAPRGARLQPQTNS